MVTSIDFLLVLLTTCVCLCDAVLLCLYD